MLGKLLKYDIKATARILLPVYAALVLATGIGKIIVSIPAVVNLLNGVVVGLMVMMYVLLVAGVFALTLFVILQRYYLNMMCDEGYLTHTLPVTPTKLILSKLINAFMWMVGSFLLVFLCIFVLVINQELWQQIPNGWASFVNFWNENVDYSIGWVFTGLIVTILLGSIMQITMFFASMSLGQSLTQHKLLGSVASYVILYFIAQIISVILMVTTKGFTWGQYNFNDVIEMQDGIRIMMGFLVQGMITTGIFSAGYFLLSRYLMHRKLNLQ